MSATQEVRRSRVLVTLLAVCLILAAILQLNGRSIFAIGEAQGKDGVFATLVQPNPKGAVAVVPPAAGPIGRLLDSASRSFGNPHPRAVANRTPAVEPGAGTPASSGATSELAAAETPGAVPGGASGESNTNAGPGAGGPPGFGSLIAPFAPISGPSGPVSGITPTPQPTPPSATPTPEPSATPPANPSPTPTQPAVNPSPTPTAPAIDPTPEPTRPVIEPTPPFATPTPPILDPTGPVSPVPEPAAWALWLLGFGVMGGLIRWRRRALDAVAAEGAGDAA